MQVLTPFFNRQYLINGAQQALFTYEEGLYYSERYELTLQSEIPMDIYLNTGSSLSNREPNEFNFDVSFKNQTYLKLTSDMFGSSPVFGVSVNINGLDTYNNQTNQGYFQATFMLYQNNQAVARSINFQFRWEHAMIAFLVVLLAWGYKNAGRKQVEKRAEYQQVLVVNNQMI